VKISIKTQFLNINVQLAVASNNLQLAVATGNFAATSSPGQSGRRIACKANKKQKKKRQQQQQQPLGLLVSATATCNFQLGNQILWH